MSGFIARLIRDDQGQDLIEYVLIGSFVSIGALTGATLLGDELEQLVRRCRGVGDRRGGGDVGP